MPASIPPLLRAEAISHHRPPASLHGVSLAIEPGGFTLLSGPADSGAGLMLRILGLLERPDAGEVWFESQAIGPLDEVNRFTIRNHLFGFLFAEPFLLDSFTVAENVAMPLFKISDFDIEQARVRTGEVLEFAGLSCASELGVFDLSPLDQHKVSLARALAISPRVLIVEDAGLQLPERDLRAFLGLVRTVPSVLGISVIATSPAPLPMLAPDREIRLEGGCVVADSHPVPVEEAPAHE